MDIYRTNQYMRMKEDVSWIIPDVLPVGGKLNIMGEPKVGKSFFALQLAEAISNPAREMLLTFPIKVHGPVFFLQADTSRVVWQDRLEKVSSHLDLTNLHWADRMDMPPNFDITRPNHKDAIRQGLQASVASDDPDSLPSWPAVIFVDVIRAMHLGEEGDSAKIQDVVDSLMDTVKPAALVVLSHTRKPPADKHARRAVADSMNEQRGSNAINGSVDTMMKLTATKLFLEPRAAEKFHVNLLQGPQGLWQLAPHVPLDDDAIDAILQDDSLDGLQAKAEALAERAGVNILRAKTALRRARRG